MSGNLKNDENFSEAEINEKESITETHIQDTPSFFERNSAVFKLLLLIFIALLLLIPKAMIEKTVQERSERNKSSFNESSMGWGGEQIVSGIFLSVPVEYKTYVERKIEVNKTGNIETQIVKDEIKNVRYLYILPETFNSRTIITPEKRYRSIYEFIFYKAENDVAGKFILKDDFDYDTGGGTIRWDDALVIMGLESTKGISEDVKVTFGESVLKMEQSIPTKEYFDSGLSVKTKIDPSKSREIAYSYKITLRGSGKMQFIPLGKSTEISIYSPWKDPSYSGSFIPVKSTVSDKGCEAEWKVLNINREYPQYWICPVAKTSIINSKFGISLIDPIDDYCKIHRAVKYLFLFITLTFAMFFLIETVQKKRVHPIQYLLIGAAVSIFYTLLLSISEHIVFDLAYAISALSVSAMLCLYSLSVLKSRKFGVLIGSATTVLYLFLFVLLKNQDYSMLLGSIGLFVSLSIIMYATRKTDWYAVRRSHEDS